MGPNQLWSSSTHHGMIAIALFEISLRTVGLIVWGLNGDAGVDIASLSLQSSRSSGRKYWKTPS